MNYISWIISKRKIYYIICLYYLSFSLFSFPIASFTQAQERRCRIACLQATRVHLRRGVQFVNRETANAVCWNHWKFDFSSDSYPQIHRLCQKIRSSNVNKQIILIYYGLMKSFLFLFNFLRVSREAAEVIKEFYLTLRESHFNTTSIPITNRQLESLIRLS